MDQRRGFWIAAALAAVAALWFSPSPASSPASAKPAEPKFTGPPDLRELAARLGGATPPTPEQSAEQRRIENEQVAQAVQLLRSASPQERIGAVEQLSAYPTRNAERALAAVLAEDKSAEVRSAAAQGLGYGKEPARETLRALLKAVRDPNEEVRRAALGTLENHLSHTERGTARFRQIVAGFRELARTRNADRQILEAIREVLADG